MKTPLTPAAEAATTYRILHAGEELRACDEVNCDYGDGFRWREVKPELIGERVRPAEGDRMPEGYYRRPMSNQ